MTLPRRRTLTTEDLAQLLDALGKSEGAADMRRREDSPTDMRILELEFALAEARRELSALHRTLDRVEKERDHLLAESMASTGKTIAEGGPARATRPARVRRQPPATGR